MTTTIKTRSNEVARIRAELRDAGIRHAVQIEGDASLIIVMSDEHAAAVAICG